MFTLLQMRLDLHSKPIQYSCTFRYLEESKTLCGLLQACESLG